MTEERSEKSNPFIQEGKISRVISTLLTKNLMERLSACIEALEFYGDIPTFSESFSILFKEIETTGKIDFTQSTSIKFDDDSFLQKKSPEEIINIVMQESQQVNIHKSDSLAYYLFYCIALLYLYKPSIRSLLTEEDMTKLLITEKVVSQNAHEALGYWTAKLEEMKKNKEHGAKAMQDKGDKNKEAIRQIMKEQNITSMDFRSDKVKRKIFYETAKKRTEEIDTKNRQPLTESRIQKIGRQILEEDNPLP